jgi:hypothetical protein
MSGIVSNSFSNSVIVAQPPTKMINIISNREPKIMKKKMDDMTEEKFARKSSKNELVSSTDEAPSSRAKTKKTPDEGMIHDTKGINIIEGGTAQGCMSGGKNSKGNISAKPNISKSEDKYPGWTEKDSK